MSICNAYTQKHEMQVHLHDYETSGEVGIPIGIKFLKNSEVILFCSILVSRQDAIRILDGFCGHMLLLTGNKVYISQQTRCNSGNS